MSHCEKCDMGVSRCDILGILGSMSRSQLAKSFLVTEPGGVTSESDRRKNYILGEENHSPNQYYIQMSPEFYRHFASTQLKLDT